MTDTYTETPMTPTAVAYYRTSSVNGLGDDKDSETRQRDAVMGYARRAGLEVVREFYDQAVKGADAVTDRPAFSQMLEYMLGNGARVILVETANRFARDLIVQLTGHRLLKDLGITLIAVDAPDHFIDETPTSVMVRQILGAVSEFEKTMLVSRMRKGRERKRGMGKRCEGRMPPDPAAIAMARKLRGQGKSFRHISAVLAEAGYTVVEKAGATGRPYHAGSVRRMVDTGAYLSQNEE